MSSVPPVFDSTVFDVQPLAACGVKRGLAPDDYDTDRLLKESVVMIVDDEPITIDIVQTFLEEAGFSRFVTSSDSPRVLSTLTREQPDILLLDLMMPEVSGFDILAAMKGESSLRRIPVIMLTSSADAETKLQALKLGATDFLAKPVDPSELALRLVNTLTAKVYQDHLTRHSVMLEHQVRLRTAQLEAAQQQILHSLASAGEFRDHETALHVVRVGRYAAIVARRLGASESWVETIQQAAQLHDVGKIGVSDAVLLKPGKLDRDEIEAMQRHCIIGTQIIRPAVRPGSRTANGVAAAEDHASPILIMAAVIAESHHEKWDGSGYPYGLRGEEIPLEGRIVAIADVFDALSSARPYKPAFPREKCLAILREGRGTHFDPRVVDAFFASLDEILAAQLELSE